MVKLSFVLPTLIGRGVPIASVRAYSKRGRTSPMIQQPDTDHPLFGSTLLLVSAL
jgi:hypothetical protein